MPSIRSSDGLLAIYPHLTGRDRHLLALLDDHQVLTTDHVHRLLFHARRTCQLRLNELRALGLLERFRFARPGGGTYPWHWTLGHHGHRFQAAARGRAEPTARGSRQRILRLSANPHLPHLLCANEFFVRLAAHARADPGVRLDRWWSESTARQQFLSIQPDGHGLWTAGDSTVGFFLEADTGSEPLGRLLAKLDAYAALGDRGGPRYPVLFWLANPVREEHLHTLLRSHEPTVPAATSTQDHHPAGPVWLPGDGYRRLPLHQLPSFHGAPGAANPNYRDGALLLPAGFLAT